MLKTVVFALVTLFVANATAAQVDGLVTKASKFPVGQALERLDKVLKGAGLTVFAVIDHRAAAEKAGLRMPATTLIVFGNPKGGTPMMLNAPTMAIDLPMRILLWEDSAGKAWVSYNTASHLAARHGLKDMNAQVEALDAALAKLTASIVE